MRRIYLILVAIIFLAGSGASICQAAEADDTEPDPLSDYLHANRLPLVEARTIVNDSGARSVLLYGYVATPFGKRDAEDQTRDFMDDPDVTITNRIVVRPELLTLGTSGNSNAAANSGEPDADNSELDDPQAATAANYATLPDRLGNSQDYANQERDDEFMLGNGAAFGGVPLVLVILGSGAIVPPLIAPPIAFGPTYYPRFSPSVYPAFHPPIGYPAGPIVPINPPFNPLTSTSAGFPRGPGYFPSPFPAGPAPMYPATGGMPFPSAAGSGIGGFAGHSFPSGFVGGGGFHSGFGGGFHGGFGGGHR